MAGEQSPTAANNVAHKGSGIFSHRHLIRKSRQHAASDGLIGRRRILDEKRLGMGDVEELLEQLADLPRGVGMDAKGTAFVHAKIPGTRPFEDTHQNEEIRGATSEDFHPLLLDPFVHLQQHRAGLRDRGDQRGGAHTTQFLGGEEHSRIARVERKIQHPAADRRDGALCIQGSEIAKQNLGAIQRGHIGRFDPAEGFQIPHPGGFEGEDRLGEVEALDFGEFAQGAPLVVALGPKPHADARRGATRPPRALGSGGGADFFNEERIDPPVGIMPCDARQARVHDERDAIDRQRGFGDIGGDDDLAPAAAIHRLVLLGGGKLAVKGKNRTTAAEPRLQLANRALDFIAPRHEDKDVAFGVVEMLRDGIGGGFPNRIFTRLVSEMDNFDRVHAPLGFQKRGVAEVGGEFRAVEGRGHHDDFEIGPCRLLQIQRPCQADVAMQVPLVELVEDNRRDAPQFGIGEHLAEQNSLGDKQEPRVAGRNIIEADLVADLAAEFHSPLAGDPRREHPRGQPPGLEDHTTTIPQHATVEEDLGNLCRFA